MKHEELTYEIIGCAHNVFNQLGPANPFALWRAAKSRQRRDFINFSSEKLPKSNCCRGCR